METTHSVMVIMHKGPTERDEKKSQRSPQNDEDDEEDFRPWSLIRYHKPYQTDGEPPAALWG